MAKPLVAIVGRPNVGKSMLFNKLTGHRTSIVEDTPGVTRDRIYGDCEWCGRTFSLVDTGGIEPGTENDMLKFMRRQAEIGIELADAIVMVWMSAPVSPQQTRMLPPCCASPESLLPWPSTSVTPSVW